MDWLRRAHDRFQEIGVLSSVSSEGRAFPEIEVAEWEQRVALVEYDGGVPRRLAEVFAQFETCPPPPGIEPGRWHGAQEAFAGLLASGIAAKALGLGWDARELIGVQRARPHDTPNRAGLIFSMRPGDTVPDVRRSGCTSLTATCATFGSGRRSAPTFAYPGSWADERPRQRDSGLLRGYTLAKGLRAACQYIAMSSVVG
jgi:hypothetical protein